jgi:prepilin-type N-terminal cleavage/methylation domain-containing protein
MSLQTLRTTRRRGFTLIELLVVIGILVVLAGILLPVISRVRDNARAADTRAQVGTLSALMQAYYGDHNAYPGPLSNMQIRTALGGQTAPIIGDGGIANSADLVSTEKITGNENAVLGLLGGLRRVGAAVGYETAWVGTGPGWLGVTPKKIPPYGDTASLLLRTDLGGELTGDYADEDFPAVTGDDSDVPEFVDRFPAPMPLLIMRARTGQRTTGTTASNNPVVTDGTGARVGQYDLSQIEGYVIGDKKTSIGSGKRLDSIDYQNVPVGEHGLKTVTPAAEGRHLPTGAANPNFNYPYDLHVALRSPAARNTPKQKDGFIIIGAGVDRVYGTNDDITNFGPYQ